MNRSQRVEASVITAMFPTAIAFGFNDCHQRHMLRNNRFR